MAFAVLKTGKKKLSINRYSETKVNSLSCLKSSRNWTKWKLLMWKGCLTLDERQDGLELEVLGAAGELQWGIAGRWGRKRA